MMSDRRRPVIGVLGIQVLAAQHFYSMLIPKSL